MKYEGNRRERQMKHEFIETKYTSINKIIILKNITVSLFMCSNTHVFCVILLCTNYSCFNILNNFIG